MSLQPGGVNVGMNKLNKKCLLICKDSAVIIATDPTRERVYSYMTNNVLISALRGALIALSVLAVSYGFNRWIKASNEKVEKAAKGLDQVTVTLPKIYLWIGIATTALFLGFAVIMSLTAGEDFSFPALLIFLFFSLLGLPLIIASSLWHIEVMRDSETFIYRTNLGRTYAIRYDEIQYYEIYPASQQVILKTANRKFYVFLNATNLGVFTDEMLLHGVKERQELRT